MASVPSAATQAVEREIETLARHTGFDEVETQHVKRALWRAFQSGSEAGYTQRQNEETTGADPITYEDFRSMFGEGTHTAFRKAVDSGYAWAVWVLISKMAHREWSAIISFVVDPIWAWLRDANVST